METEKKRTRDREREDGLLETDLANEKMGNNQLQGNDQEDVRNQRHAVPDARREPEEIIESFEKMDPKVRAERQKKARR